MLITCLLLVVTAQAVLALDNGLALTPPMGWLSWERFRCNINCKDDPDNCISEKLYMKMADLLVSEGFRDVGYVYVNIDDCWPAMQRDANGKLVADPQRFPSGIKALAKYMHDRGLKLGIYEDFGHLTCAGYPGSEFYMETDANTFAEWDVDMLKFDGCNSDPKDMPYGYPIMGHYLNMTGRPILYLCQWPGYLQAVQIKPDYAAVRKSCNSWRNYHDVQDSWDSVTKIIDYYGTNADGFAQYAGPGGWNDPDMLVVGDFGLSYYQQKAQFGMWALFSSPLFMSLDLRSMDVRAKALLQNKNIIAINQDPAGHQAVRLFEVPGSLSVWLKPMAKKGLTAIGLLNKDDQGKPLRYKTSLSDIGFEGKFNFNITDAFENKFVRQVTVSEEFVTYVDPTSIYIMFVQQL